MSDQTPQDPEASPPDASNPYMNLPSGCSLRVAPFAWWYTPMPQPDGATAIRLDIEHATGRLTLLYDHETLTRFCQQGLDHATEAAKPKLTIAQQLPPDPRNNGNHP